MSFRLARDVFEVLRGSARTKSLDQLRREGHRNVPVLKFSELEALLGATVEDALKRLGLELSEHQVQGLNEEARLRFLALLRERQQLQDTLENLQRQGDKLEVTTEGVRAEIERAESELVEQQAEPTGHDEELEDFRRRLRQSLDALLTGASGVDADLSARVAAAVDEAIENYRILVAAHARRSQEARVEQLERRLHRLRRKLEESELLLAKARQAGADGMPVLFDVGRALAPGDADYAQKRDLLDEVFKLNVELRRMLAVKEPPPTTP